MSYGRSTTKRSTSRSRSPIRRRAVYSNYDAAAESGVLKSGLSSGVLKMAPEYRSYGYDLESVNALRNGGSPMQPLRPPLAPVSPASTRNDHLSRGYARSRSSSPVRYGGRMSPPRMYSRHYDGASHLDDAPVDGKHMSGLSDTYIRSSLDTYKASKSYGHTHDKYARGSADNADNFARGDNDKYTRYKSRSRSSSPLRLATLAKGHSRSPHRGYSPVASHGHRSHPHGKALGGDNWTEKEKAQMLRWQRASSGYCKQDSKQALPHALPPNSKYVHKDKYKGKITHTSTHAKLDGSWSNSLSAWDKRRASLDGKKM